MGGQGRGPGEHGPVRDPFPVSDVHVDTVLVSSHVFQRPLTLVQLGSEDRNSTRPTVPGDDTAVDSLGLVQVRPTVAIDETHSLTPGVYYSGRNAPRNFVTPSAGR